VEQVHPNGPAVNRVLTLDTRVATGSPGYVLQPFSSGETVLEQVHPNGRAVNRVLSLVERAHVWAWMKTLPEYEDMKAMFKTKEGSLRTLLSRKR
jgi:hypothetical protein